MKLFKFEKSDVTLHIEYELKTLDKFKEPLNYIIKALTRLGHSMEIKSLDKKIDLNKIKEKEGKNYHWSTFTYKNATLVIRRYKQHLTIFTKVVKGVDYKERPKNEYGAFTFHTDFEKFGNKHDAMMDMYYNKPFTDLNVIVKDLFNLLLEKDSGVYWVWNSAMLKRPKHVEIKLAFDSKTISSLDNFVFCMEEIDSIFLTLFAESTMIQKLKEYKTGEKLNKQYKTGRITTTVKDEYYHSTGMELIDATDKNKSNFQDVYSLSRYYFEDVFKDGIYIYEGEVYVKGGSFKIGEAVAYKDDYEYDNVTLFKKDFIKEKFVPLKKY